MSADQLSSLITAIVALITGLLAHFRITKAATPKAPPAPTPEAK